MSAKYVIEIKEDRKGFHIGHTLYCAEATRGEALGVATIRDLVGAIIDSVINGLDPKREATKREGGAEPSNRPTVKPSNGEGTDL
ncbi:MAG: hypothetical protein IJQ73_06010 [Kiritimatiellae bacterium]|nr:hypothetical protein [Kiritimatiellia bacterium]